MARRSEGVSALLRRHRLILTEHGSFVRALEMRHLATGTKATVRTGHATSFQKGDAKRGGVADPKQAWVPGTSCANPEKPQILGMHQPGPADA